MVVFAPSSSRQSTVGASCSKLQLWRPMRRQFKEVRDCFTSRLKRIHPKASSSMRAAQSSDGRFACRHSLQVSRRKVP